MGEKKLFSNKKIQTKKIQLCTAFGYNCFSIKSLLFWKELFLTSSGAWGSRESRGGPGWRCHRDRLLFSSRRCRAKPAPGRRSLSCPFVPALHRPAASLPASLRSGPRSGHCAGEVKQRRGQWGRLDGEVPMVSTGPGGAAPGAARVWGWATVPADTGLLAAGGPARPRGGQDLSPLSSGLFCFYS